VNAILPARRVPAQRDGARMLVLEAAVPAIVDAGLRDLPRWLGAGDVLIVNDAATLPASLHGRSGDGSPIELRLSGPITGDRAPAVLFGAGDHRIKTEHRPAPPLLEVGDVIELGALRATITQRAALSPRLVEVRFDRGGDALWAALYRSGRPIQYAYHDQALPLYAFQTAYATRPWAAEMPSAGRPLTWSLLLALRAQCVGVHALTHAAGLSATGDPAIDSALPLPERFDLPAQTLAAIARARAGGGRVIAAGTSVVRALEGSAALHGGTPRAGAGETALIIDDRFVPRVVDGLLTGVHDPSDSHFRLLRAFADAAALAAAHAHAFEHGYVGHEFGDSMLVLRTAPANGRATTGSSALASGR
jgi:S-adenosylmethionine:tRNA ribosyltransferase-isomerase